MVINYWSRGRRIVYFNQGSYATSLTHFEAALRQPVGKPIELNDIRLYTAISHRELGKGKKEMELHLRKAIAYYDTVLGFYTEQNYSKEWAQTQINLGNVYLDLPTGNRNENIQKAITAYENALRVLDEKEHPFYWTMAKNNLGNAYASLTLGNRTENLKKAIELYEKSIKFLRIKNK
jgi:tetratricopeptide (TPR) repeat protein